MKLVCTQENLNKGLNLVSRMISTRTALPILSHVLLKTDKGRLKLSATDLEIGINAWVGAKVEKEGTITVPGRLLSDFVSTCNDKNITLVSEKQELNLKSDKYQAKIKGSSAEEFPLIPEVKNNQVIEIPAELTREAISQVAIATAIDESRPVLAGILWKIDGKTIKMVATDSYRLAEKTILLDKKVDKKHEVIIPTKTMHEVARTLSGISASALKATFSENQIQFNIDDTVEIVSRLIEGNFPNYEQIIPQKYTTKVGLDKEQFSNIIKMASLFAREAANNIKIDINKNGKVKVVAAATQIGENTSEMPAKVEGESGEISFNAKFVLDALNVIPDNKIDLEITTKLNPGVLRQTSSKNYLYIIMPLRTE